MSVEKNTIKLLPCPFCEGAGEFVQGYYGTDDEDNFAVRCAVCGSTEGGAGELNEGVEYTHASKAEAAVAWNKRVGGVVTIGDLRVLSEEYHAMATTCQKKAYKLQNDISPNLKRIHAECAGKALAYWAAKMLLNAVIEARRNGGGGHE